MLFSRDPLAHLHVRTASRETIDPEEIFSDAGVYLPEDADEVYERQKKLEVPTNRYMSHILGFIVAVGFLFLFFRIGYMNFAQGAHYIGLAQKNAERAFTLLSPRGDVFDSYGKVLATTRSGFDVEARMSLVQEGGTAFVDLVRAADVRGDSYEVILKRLESAQEKHTERVILARSVPLEDIGELEERLRPYAGIVMRERPLRSYPYGAYAAHVLGYTGSVSEQDIATGLYFSYEEIGKDGIEAVYDAQIRGKAGQAVVFVDAVGRPLGEKIVREAYKGSDIITTLDIGLQKISFEALEKALRQKGLRSGAVVALDPRDGAVRALVSLPSFDPNSFAAGFKTTEYKKLIGDSSKPLFNRASSGEYSSGSVIKPFLAAGALEERIISSKKVLYTNGAISVPSVYDPSVIYTFRDWKNHGAVDMRRAIAVSSNVYFYTIGGGYEGQEGLGIERIKKYLSLFGWGAPTGIDLPFEASGFLPTPAWKKEKKQEEWFIGDTYNASIGQGDVLVTPLQLANALAGIANGGFRITPHLVDRVGIEKYSFAREPLSIAPENIQPVREGMRAAVVEGSSQMLNSLPVKIAGKTGTAQVDASRGVTNAFFMGFAPYENPELVLVVLLEKGGESTEAVKVAKEILEHYFSTDTGS